jgi:hypothetical protein
MADATYAIPSFLGGEISDFAQGRFDKPDYRASLNICLNSYPVEIGAWTRRPGTMHAGTTRGGAEGRTIKFDFEQASAVTLELTDSYLRARSGATLIGTNDDQVVVAVSTANPAVVQVQNVVNWATGNTLIFPGASTPLLENRQFVATKIDTTHFSLVDALTGANIDGSTLGALVTGATVRRVQELVTLYTGGAWANVRAVQAETTDILLCPLIPPQALTVTTLPSLGVEPQFEIRDSVFIDGPYLDPFKNGVQATPSATSGIINLTLSFAAWSSTQAYAKDSFVTYLSVDYISLSDQNVNHTPSGSPAYWAATSAAVAVNDGRGFLGTDTGRLVRLLSEPPLWNVATAYTAGQVVSYNPSGVPGAATYWQAAASTTGTPPGSTLTIWDLIASGAAIWTWGRITGFSNIIDRALAGSSSIGDMTLFNGITAPFDGNFSKPVSSSAAESTSGGGVSPGETKTLSSYVGKFYGAGLQIIQQATIYPTTDRGFGFAEFSVGGTGTAALCVFTLNLRANTVAPGSPSDGALLGTTSFSGSSSTTTIISNDQVTAWAYVWIEMIISTTWPGPSFASSYSITSAIAQISFFNPTSSASSSAGCTVEILGPPLKDTTPIVTWRLGVYSNTTGWPTCGTYHEGRLWLGGAVPNRFDASVSDGIDGHKLDFSPTNQYGVVAASNALSYTLNSDGVNPMFWMKPDLLGVVIGTQQGEWLVQAPTTGPIAPTNIAARRMTKHGSENVDPARTEHANLFVKRYGRKLMEYFADAYSGKFSAPNLADKAGHIVSAGIVELAYTEAVTPIVWGRDTNDALFGMTYRRTAIATAQPPDFYAWHRQELGSGRTVESISAGPSVGGDLDTLTLVTNDATTNIHHVELLTDTPDENTELADAWFLDNAVEPTSTVVDVTTITETAPYGGVTMNGLWHLNGETVQVFAGGLDLGDLGTAGPPGYYTDLLVTNGSCFVPFGDGIDAGPGRGLFTASFMAENPRIVVGFTYTSDGQLVRPISPADSGARNGPAFGKTRRNHQYSVLVSNTLGVSFGGTFPVVRPAQFRKPNGNPLDPLTMFSGVHHDSLDDDYSYDGMVAWRVTRPWPANIVAISGNIQTQDR